MDPDKCAAEKRRTFLPLLSHVLLFFVYYILLRFAKNEHKRA